MELSVRPDDLLSAAVALRRVAADLDAALSRFEAAAAGCLGRLPPTAAVAAGPAAHDAARAVGALVEGQRAAAAGLHATAAGYAHTDGRLVRAARPGPPHR